MRTQTIKNFNIIVPETRAFNIDTPEELMKMHMVLIASGKRGSGKGVATMNLLKRCQDAKCLDRLFIISPTIYSNKHILDMVKYDQNDVYEEPTRESLDKVIEAVEQEAADYEDYIEKMKIYKKYIKYMKTGRGLIMDDELYNIWDSEKESFEIPTHKWGGKKPIMCLFLDDIQGSQIFAVKSKLSNVIIRHRHLGQLRRSHGALGLSIVINVQSYKSAGGGLPRAIRGQATCMMLFKSKDENELNDIAEECSGEVSKETFMKVYNEAIKEPHDFLFIDFHPKQPKYMFRRCFNTLILPDELKKDKDD